MQCALYSLRRAYHKKVHFSSASREIFSRISRRKSPPPEDAGGRGWGCGLPRCCLCAIHSALSLLESVSPGVGCASQLSITNKTACVHLIHHSKFTTSLATCQVKCLLNFFRPQRGNNPPENGGERRAKGRENGGRQTGERENGRTGERENERMGERENGGRETEERIASSARDACLLAMTRGLRNDMGPCIVCKHPFLSLRGGPIHRADVAIRNPNPSTPQGLSCRQTSCRYIVLRTMGYMALRPGDIWPCGQAIYRPADDAIYGLTAMRYIALRAMRYMLAALA